MDANGFYTLINKTVKVYIRHSSHEGKVKKKDLSEALDTLRDYQIGDMIIEQYHMLGINGDEQSVAMRYLECSIGVLFDDARRYLADAHKADPKEREELLRKADESRNDAERNVCLAKTLQPELEWFLSLKKNFSGLYDISENLETEIAITKRHPYSFRERIQLKDAVRRTDYEQAKTLKDKIDSIEKKRSTPL